ncbi:MAG: EF-hand domain-containing protein [Terrimicrobiaceae bacterium]
MKRLLLAASALATVFISTGCQTTGTTDRFAKADSNKDGKLTSDEASDYIVIGIFESLDANKDGKLSLSECAVETNAVAVKDFHKRDLNKDGTVTREEAIAYGRKKGMVAKAFPKADKNQDGSLSRAEVNSFYGSKEGPL